MPERFRVSLVNSEFEQSKGSNRTPEKNSYDISLIFIKSKLQW